MKIEQERAKASLPDKRLVTYFTRYLEPTHSFVDQTRIRRYIEEVTCVWCNNHHEYNGWNGLCDRSCYYELSALHTAYEQATDDTPPDPRLVAYFKRYPEPTHSFTEPVRILAFIKKQIRTCYWCQKPNVKSHPLGFCSSACCNKLYSLHHEYHHATDNAPPDPRLVVYFSNPLIHEAFEYIPYTPCKIFSFIESQK